MLEGGLMEAVPFWFFVLAAVCGLIVSYMIPSQIAEPVGKVLIHSPAAKLVAGFAAAVGFCVIIYTAYQIRIDLLDRNEDRIVRYEELIDRSWSRLLAHAAGNTGKGGALSILVQNDIPVDYVDVSCRAVGSWDSQGERCRRPAILADIRIGRPGQSVVIQGLDLSDEIIPGAELWNSTLLEVNVVRTRFVGSKVRGAAISGNIDGLVLDRGYFIRSTISRNIFRRQSNSNGGISNRLGSLKNLNISNSVVPIEDFDEVGVVYYWGDSPPFQGQSVFEAFPAPDDRRRRGHPWGLNVLNKLIACRVPSGPDGESIPFELRQHDFSYYGCDRMSALGAMMQYPEAYALSDDYEQ